MELVINLENLLKSMKLGIMYSDLSFSMIGVSEISKHGNMLLLDLSQQRMV